MELIRELGQLFVTVLLTGFGISVVIPAMTDVTVESVCPGRDQCSLAIYLAGFQQAITGFGAMFVIPLIGSLSDKYGRKSLLTVSIALSIMPPAILAYERSTSFFYAYYVMKTLTAMLCDGALLSLALAYTADKIPADRRISAFGIISGAFSASFLCGSFAARFLPIDATFKVAMGASLLATVYMRVFLEESIPYEIDELSQPISKTEGEGDVDVPELSRRALTTFKRVPSIKEVIRLLRSSSTFSRTAMVCFFNNLTLGWLQASLMYYLKDRFHSNKDQFASLMIFFGALGTISQSFVLSIAWSFWVIYASCALFLLSFCAIPTTCSIASKQVGAHNQGKAQGCLFGIQSFAYAISPLIFNPLAALFLSEDAPFDFPGFSILCIGLNTMRFSMELRLCPPPFVIGGSVRLSLTLRRLLPVRCTALTKQSHRFLSTLATTAAAGDQSATNRLIRKFVASSPRSIALNVLSRILSSHTPQPALCFVALTLYSRITEASWFTWNSRLVADLVAFLDKHGQFTDSEALISEATSKLGFQERKLVSFYCQLVESQSKHGSERGFDNSYDSLLELLHNSTSVYVRRRAFESIVSGLCAMKRPEEAESLVKEMRSKGIAPSSFEYRSVIYAYGTLGLFEDMKRSLEQMEKDDIDLDTVCSNMVLSSYGAHNKLADMLLWLQTMKTSSLPFSVRTYNSVLNSCPKLMSMLQDMSAADLPLSIEDLITALYGNEALLVEELVGSSVLKEVMVWDSMELKLDFHGAHVGAAYVIMLQWMKEMKLNFEDENSVIPAEVIVICGSGNHSIVRGESPLKALIKEIMVRTGSPLRIDRKNTGCFVSKGKAVKNWLCLR